jgi:glycosyltransferase involved in cell wall biosynthesis
MSRAPSVSVVTPVYNGERFLDECIRSVLDQTYTDWEYVIVDNASADRTGAIADRYAAMDARIRVRHETEFLGIYGNHNRALRAIDQRSRYTKIVHADDVLYPECLERMVAVAEEHPSVGVVSAYNLVDRQIHLDGLLTYSEATMPGRDVVRHHMLNRPYSSWVTGSPTSLLLRTDLCRDGDFYDESFWHADAEAGFRALMCSDLGFVHQVLTFTRIHPGALSSFTNRVNTYKPEEGRLVARYGPQVLSRAEYRKRLRRWFATYGRFLAREMLRPGRYQEREFYEFHRCELDAMAKEAGPDPELRVVLALYRRLLPRSLGAGRRRLEPTIFPGSGALRTPLARSGAA